jgi:hypothetical protein
MRVTDVNITPEYRLGKTGIELSHIVIRFSTTDHTEMPSHDQPTMMTLPVIGPISALCVSAAPTFIGTVSWDCEWIAVGPPLMRAICPEADPA